MICNFDFYSITAESTTIKPMLAAGIERTRIEREFSHWETYGRNQYRRFKYIARLGYVDAHTPTTEQQISEISSRWKDTGLKLRVRYIPVD